MIKKTQRGTLAGVLATACLCIWTGNAATNDADPAATNAAPPATTNAAVKDDALFPDPVVAKAKGFQIKRSTLNDAIIAIKSEAAAQRQPIPDQIRANLEWDVLHDLIFKEILSSKASDTDKATAKENCDKFFVDIRAKFPNEEALQAQVKAVGMTMEQFQKRKLEESVCAVVLDRELKSKITVSDDQVKKFYDDNPDKFEQPERVRASHVLISTLDKDQNPLSEDKKKEKEKLAKEVKAKADKGDDFAKLAKDYSDDPGSKEKGGEYTFGRGEMVKEFEAAAFSLKTNQVSDLVETRYGYHIIKLSEKIAASKIELAKVSDKIKEFQTRQEVMKRMPDYRTQLEKEAGVEVIGIKEPPKPVDETAADDKKPAADEKK